MTGSVVGAIFRCETCGKSWDRYRTAQDEARRHSIVTGHKTVGEVTRYFAYGATEPKGAGHE